VPERLEGPRATRSSDTGRRWLAGLECGKKGPRLKAYLDRPGPKGVWTIGVGQVYIEIQGRLRRVEPGDAFNTLSDALNAFYKRLRAYEVTVDACVRDDVSQTAFDAATSVCWNAGQGAFAKARWVRLLNDYAPVADVGMYYCTLFSGSALENRLDFSLTFALQAALRLVAPYCDATASATRSRLW